MIKPTQLLQDLKRRLVLLEDDLRARIAEVPELAENLRSEWQAARDAGRCAETFETWAEQVQTQAAVHWLLSCVFLRFIEDNALVERPWISGPLENKRLHLARDRHEAYFQQHPLESDRDYLLACFSEAGQLPGLATFFDASHNPVFRLGISGAAAIALRQFWQQQDPNTGALLHDFTDSEWNTRFLGDLYQDLSEATRKRYALLQTPEFVEEFILDRTLTPALNEFGVQHTKLLDPTCGSGHFLLGGFARLLEAWTRAELQHNRRYLAQKALDAVAGVDLNPFAVAISRFRLLLAALKASDIHLLAHAPSFQIHVAIGDSLLHGKRFGMKQTEDMFQAADDYAATGLAHAYASEDLQQVQKILGQQYQAVVGNPPYIVVKDAALNKAYRDRYDSCHMKYSLGAPFTERFFELAVTGDMGQVKGISDIANETNEQVNDGADDAASTSTNLPPRPLAGEGWGEGRSEGKQPGAGYVGLITANSFMKREFGSKLIEEVLPKLDLTHVIDTSGAYIPGHGTPTVILFGRHRNPVNNTVRTVMRINGEPSAPENPAKGLVWSAIIEQIDTNGSEGDYVGVSDTDRSVFCKHPWSIGGGGATELKAKLEFGAQTLRSISAEIGITSVNGEDELFLLQDYSHAERINIEHVRSMITGDLIRDWVASSIPAVWLYDEMFNLFDIHTLEKTKKYFWNARVTLGKRKRFGTPMIDRGLTWYEYQEIYISKLKMPLTITFSFVATHNHFVFDRGEKTFNRSAPVIKLQATKTLAEHIAIAGLLNSSTACFWMKQVFHDKGNGGIGGGIASEDWELFYEFTSTGIAEYPLPKRLPINQPVILTTLAQELQNISPFQILEKLNIQTCAAISVYLQDANEQTSCIRRKMIALQEELDWQCYRLYDLLPDGGATEDYETTTPPEIALGERAFEIVLARRIAAGKENSTWFERHGSTPITEIPAHWPPAYQALVQRRIDLIGRDRNIALIERPEYKRRWNTPSWESLEQTALRDWLLARLETPHYWPREQAELATTYKLAELARQDQEFVQVAGLYAGHVDVDIAQLVAELVAPESVPCLPQMRYTEAGMRKRAQWEATWQLQRQEDAIDQECDSAMAQEWQTELANITSRYAALPATAQELMQEEQTHTQNRLRQHYEVVRAERKAQEVGKIPVPPKYVSKDFLKTDFWRLRGGLDVPKERWHSLPGCERSSDSSLVIGWAGWDHLQLASSLAGYYLQVKDNEAWEAERLMPILASLQELLPWLKQWHNELHPEFGERMGDYYASFVAEEAKALGTTLPALRAWEPVVVAKGRKKKGSV